MMNRIVIPISDPQYKGVIQEVVSLIDNIMLINEESLIKYAQFCEALPIEYYRTSLVLMWREAIEFSDGICSLVLGSSCNIANVLLRSIFDLLLGIKFIYSDVTKIKQRALAYSGIHVIKTIENYRRFSLNEEGYDDYRACIGIDIVENISDKFDSKLAISNLEQIFSKYPEYAEFKNEYDRFVQQKCRKKQGLPQWYELFDGCKSIFMLAERIGMKKYYLTLYEQFSEKGHGLSAMKNIKVDNIKNPKIPDFKLLIHNIDLLLSFLSGIATEILKHEMPNEYAIYARKHLSLRKDVSDLSEHLMSIKLIYEHHYNN